MTDTISKILQYYAVMQLVSLPLTFVLLVFLYKKTNYIERFNSWLDRFFGLTEKENKAADDESRRLTAKEKIAQDMRDAKTGVTTLKLAIGQSYHCRLSMSLIREGGLYKCRWYPENGFVGDVDSEGVFTAKKAGETDIYCEGNNISDDQAGQHVYKIIVVPEDAEWNPGLLFKLLYDGAERKKIMARLYDRRISNIREDINAVDYRRGKTDEGLRMQFDYEDRLQRFVLMLGKKWKENGLKNIERALDERFDPVKMEQGQTRIWMHKYITESETLIDHYCFIKELSDGNGVLCFSRTWREYSDELEFLQNIAMAELTFIELLPELKPDNNLKANIPDDVKLTPPKKEDAEEDEDVMLDKEKKIKTQEASDKDIENAERASREITSDTTEGKSTSGIPETSDETPKEKNAIPARHTVQRRRDTIKNQDSRKTEKEQQKTETEEKKKPAEPVNDADSADFEETYSQTPDIEDDI